MIAFKVFTLTVNTMAREPALKLTLDNLILPTVQQDLSIREPLAKSWMAQLPQSIEKLCQQWNLTPIEALHGGRAGCVVKVQENSDYGPGATRVLKVALNSARAAQEAAALELFSPNGGTPQLFNVDVSKNALLIDWVETSQTMRSVREFVRGELPTRTQIAQLADLINRLRTNNQIVGNNLELLAVPKLDEFHRERLNAGGTLREVVRGSRPPTPANLERAKATLDYLKATAPKISTSRTLIHGDLNSGNILGGDNPLKAVDPRPLRGDPTYDTAILALKCGEKVAEDTAKLLAATLGDNIERVLCWVFVARVSRV